MAPTYLPGPQATNSVLANERKIDIDPRIYYLQGDISPLVHLAWGGRDKATQLPIKREAVDDPKFKVFEKEPHGAWTAINYGTGYTAGATSLLCDAVDHIRIGFVLKVVGGEQILVTGRNVSNKTIDVIRGFGTTAAASIADNTPLYTIGDANAEFGALPSALKVKTRERDSYTQILREPVAISGTLAATTLQTGKKIGDLRFEAFMEWKKRVERAFIWSEPKEDTTADTTNGFPTRTTGGLYYWIASTGNVTPVSTTLTKSVWTTFARNLFKYGSNRKIVLCAPYVIDALSYWKDYKLEFRPTDYTHDVRVYEWETGHGTMLIVRDAMLENSPFGSGAGYGGVAIGFDPDNVSYKYLRGRDVAYFENVKKDGSDGQWDEYRGEVGLGCKNPETGWILSGISDYST